VGLAEVMDDGQVTAGVALDAFLVRVRFLPDTLKAEMNETFHYNDEPPENKNCTYGGTDITLQNVSR